MRLPAQTAHYSRRVRHGQYVTARLLQAELKDLANDTQTTTDRVKAAGRKVEDADTPVLTAMANRDAADSDMDAATQAFRLKLSSRSLNAAKEAPYTQIFPKGVGFYIAAPVSSTEKRYQELITRVEASLPETDELRGALITAVTAGLERYKTAISDLASARTALAMARTESDAQDDEWDTLMEKTFGVLIERFGKKRANGFFPRTRHIDSDNEGDAPSPSQDT